MNEFLILGCGYTGRRVAQRLMDAGAPIVCTNRAVSPIPGATVLALDATDPHSFEVLWPYLRPGMRVLHSIPLIRSATGLSEYTGRIAEALHKAKASRVVYLSTTGVYGTAATVDEHTQPSPKTERELLRTEAERIIAAGPWSSLILRPAAIYGPGRGVQASMQQGTFRLPKAGGVISRIHVDDLASHAVAALRSDLTGAFPVADEEPCSSQEVAEFTAELLKIPLPPTVPVELLGETQRANRRVDGSAIRRALGIQLQYPSYRQGIPASLA